MWPYVRWHFAIIDYYYYDNSPHAASVWVWKIILHMPTGHFFSLPLFSLWVSGKYYRWWRCKNHSSGIIEGVSTKEAFFYLIIYSTRDVILFVEDSSWEVRARVHSCLFSVFPQTSICVLSTLLALPSPSIYLYCFIFHTCSFVITRSLVIKIDTRPNSILCARAKYIYIYFSWKKENYQKILSSKRFGYAGERSKSILDSYLGLWLTLSAESRT